MLRLALAFILFTIPAFAEEVVLGLSKDEVAITTSFDGSEILIFGAVKRDEPIPEGDPLGVIIAISGPSEAVTVRRKEKRFGIWVNVDSVEVDHAPSFYAVATSGPLDEVLHDLEDVRFQISIPRAIRSVGAPENVENPTAFADAIIRIRESTNAYQLLENEIKVVDQTLFQTSIQLPAALTTGDYATRIFLTREGKVVSSYETSIVVRKVGLERWLYTLSRENAFLYGLMSLAIAIAAGWGASAIFRLVRP